MSYLCSVIRNKNSKTKNNRDMTQVETIKEAIKVMQNHDWYWMMADYCTEPMNRARGNMRYFVELAASLNNITLTTALRDLWTATHKYISATMWASNDEAKAKYEAKKQELMAILLPCESSMAA